MAGRVDQAALKLLDDRGIPESLSMMDLQRRLQDITGRDLEYYVASNLEGKEIHGVWGSDLEQNVDMVYCPPGNPTVQYFIIQHEHGHMIASPNGAGKNIGANPEIVELLGTAIPLGRRLDFTFQHSDFSAEEERLAEMVGAELAVRVLRYEKGRGKDFQFGRVFER
ncbi:hypothetical protein N8D74_17865 (plasmid) [Curtobacterium flaccumfaciens]|uniref:Uncharacterized protein n=1 Tax=Curtobacterium poinsettiae TaxID=159612 RepID=A0A9Q9T4Y0_9MICO|nr:hypothetical protein [Curtobacterium flaccumfaciens]MBT1620593.1 hypothetical protein [Curtobacterium flaccumfaciens pv. poinsettiae]MCS6563623.1 hypothetical protein [Curtobacterium flaccumfaciens pv. poinsettiae]MCU0154561.1 hypothetical protein [Curtobacterium flaccumfaciens pv. poinsettiae]UXN16902.1 hypothetical protein N8D76_17560 [Curtobacterium flaccumfaciens pv. poinsettiae]UXN27149.1 hypothetical protein N8D74_17865 [Curtobacterium flaccumfaciens]